MNSAIDRKLNDSQGKLVSHYAARLMKELYEPLESRQVDVA